MLKRCSQGVLVFAWIISVCTTLLLWNFSQDAFSTANRGSSFGGFVLPLLSIIPLGSLLLTSFALSVSLLSTFFAS
jgi:hypothetical protein